MALDVKSRLCIVMVQSSDARPRRSDLYPASVDLGHSSGDALRGGRAFLAEVLSWEAEAERVWWPGYVWGIVGQPVSGFLE